MAICQVSRYLPITGQSSFSSCEECPDVYVGDEDECKRFVEAVLWMDRSGAPWGLLPAEHGNWSTIYKRYAR